MSDVEDPTVPTVDDPNAPALPDTGEGRENEGGNEDGERYDGGEIPETGSPEREFDPDRDPVLPQE